MTMAIHSQRPEHQKPLRPTIGKNDPEDLNETDNRYGYDNNRYDNRHVHGQQERKPHFLSPQQQFHHT